MAITGAHVLLYTPEAEALRAQLRNVIGWNYVDAHDGWLIFNLPPAELAVHPSEGSTRHELTFMCDDVATTAAELREKGLQVGGDPEELGFGVGVTLVLSGGVEVLLYEPRHETAI